MRIATSDEAITRIIFHAQPAPGAFLEMLRPYRGVVDDVLADLEAALHAAAPRLVERELPRELVSALWAISYLGRSWAVEPDGMVRRNHLISDADLARLETFLDHFGYAVTMLFDDCAEAAFADWPS